MQVEIPKSAILIAEAFVFYWEAIKSFIGRLTRVYVHADNKIIEANMLRAAADRIRIQHPNIAKELYAAADRHERVDE